MAELTEKELEHGRYFIKTRDIDGLIRWIDNRKININKDVVKTTFEKLFKFDSPSINEKALKLFDAAFVGIDPEAELLRIIIIRIISWAIIILVGLGIAGGIKFLFWG